MLLPGGTAQTTTPVLGFTLWVAHQIPDFPWEIPILYHIQILWSRRRCIHYLMALSSVSFATGFHIWIALEEKNHTMK